MRSKVNTPGAGVDEDGTDQLAQKARAQEARIKIEDNLSA